MCRFYPHRTDEKIEAQQGHMTCPSLTASKW